MEDTANLANDLPTIIVISIWWTLLSIVELIFPSRDFGYEPEAVPPPGASTAVAPASDDDRFGMLRQFDPDFDEQALLTGAANAYETILRAFCQGDLKTLRPLLSPEVFAAFANAIAERAARQETTELTFIGFDETTIVHAQASFQEIEIDVRFAAQIVSLTRSAAGDIVDGDPIQIARTTDLWTFARKVPAEDRTWQVIATDAA